MSKNNTVAVIGLGYVGLPLAILLVDKGYDVIGVDVNKNSVKQINSGVSPVKEGAMDEILKNSPINAVTDINDASHANTFIICVPTPVKNGVEPDLDPVRAATKSVASVIKSGDMVIVESTINPGVCDETIIPMLEKESGININEIYLVHCPERINPGDPKWNVRNISRVVGASSMKALALGVNFYKSIIDAEIKPMDSLKEAEAVKIVENSFRDVNIAFVNELAKSFSKMGIDIENVIDGAATKPFAFMAHRPGVGVGGHCIPVDPYYLIEYAKGFDFDHEFLSLARRINSEMPAFTVATLESELEKIDMDNSKARVAVLGISYKPNVGDDRESPFFSVIRELKNRKITFMSFDPYIRGDASSIEDVLDFANVILVVTGHREFQEMTLNQMTKNNIKLVIDGRNIFKNIKTKITSSGIGYRGIGI